MFYKFDGAQQMDTKVKLYSNENLGISISFGGDIIFLGDAFKNTQVLQVMDSEQLRQKEKVDDPDKFISVNHLCSNKINEKVISVHTMRAAERHEYNCLSQIEKQSLSIRSVAESGYIRL